MSIEEFAAKGSELQQKVAMDRLVGLRFCKSVDEIPEKARRPMRDFGFHMAVCQGLNASRMLGHTIALDLDDDYCLPGASQFGLTSYDMDFHPHHVKDRESGDQLNAVYAERNALLEGGSYEALVFSPFDRLLVEPDMVIGYGIPGQVGRLAKALTWHGTTSSAMYLGGAGCSAIVFSFVEHTPVFTLPAGGEKLLAGTNDYQISIVFPADMLDDALTGFKGTQRMLPYPSVCTTLLNEPVVPADYPITYKELAK